MSNPVRRVTVLDLAAAKRDRRPFTMVTAYDWPTGQLADAAGVDCVLVGDSVAMVVAGRSSTIPATLDQMIYHGEIVSRAVSRAMVIVDLPFPLQHLGVRTAIESCARMLKVGLRPQAVHQLGGYRMQRDIERLMADAEAAAHAGACAVVLECVPQEVAATITQSIAVPTIGIGAGLHCDGQVLVMHDLIGLSTGRVPRFVRAYADVKASVGEALARWRDDVEHRRFPGSEETLG